MAAKPQDLGVVSIQVGWGGQRVWKTEVPQWGPGAKPGRGIVPQKLKHNVKLVYSC